MSWVGEEEKDSKWRRGIKNMTPRLRHRNMGGVRWARNMYLSGWDRLCCGNKQPADLRAFKPDRFLSLAQKSPEVWVTLQSTCPLFHFYQTTEDRGPISTVWEAEGTGYQ